MLQSFGTLAMVSGEFGSRICPHLQRKRSEAKLFYAKSQGELRVKALIGTKLGMISMIDKDGAASAVTLIQAGPMTVTQVRTLDKDGYQALQLGYGQAKAGKSRSGHLKASGSEAKHLKEFRTDEESSVGEKYDVSAFSEGDSVKVSGTTKGKGFAGTVKRHNFHRGPKTHGSNNYRRPGSIGSMYPQKVFKGKRMAGHMGGDRASVRNLRVAFVDPEQNLIGIFGPVPGPSKAIVTIRGIES